MEHLGQEDLLILVRQSNYAAFNEMHKRHYPILYSLALKKLGDEDAAFDLLQDMFLELWEKRENFHISNPLPNYLKNRLWFKLSGHFRKQGFQDKHYAAFATYLDQDLTSEEDVLDLQEMEQQYQELINRIDQLVESMPEKMRQVFKLSQEGRYGIAEIASQLDISPKTVSRQVNMGLEYLRRSLSEVSLATLQLLILAWLTKN